MQCIFSTPHLSPIVNITTLRISGLFLILLFVFIISSSSVHLIQITHTRVVLPRMMCRFSNTDSEVRFSAQDWISRNPEGWTIYSQRSWLKPELVTLIFPLPVISLTVRKYSSFSVSIGGILWKGSLQWKKKRNLTCNSWISHILMYRTISGFCWRLVDWWMLAQWSWPYIKSGPGRASPWSWWWFTFKILLMCERAGFSHPMKEVLRKCTSPLILVQFLKRSMLEAFTAMVLIKAPTPMPSQTGEENTVSLVL